MTYHVLAAVGKKIHRKGMNPENEFNSENNEKISVELRATCAIMLRYFDLEKLKKMIAAPSTERWPIRPLNMVRN